MVKKVIFAFVCSIAAAGSVCPQETAVLPQAPLSIAAVEPFKKTDRVLILAPHPDDESIACGGVIQSAVAAGAEVRVAYLTNGDHNELAFIVFERRLTFRTSEFIHMGEVRKKEAIAAMKLLGVGESKLTFLGYPDFGTFTIFSQYWQSKKPFRSLLTRISKVPYKGNLSYKAPYVGESILQDIKQVLLQYKPNKVFVSHPADTNVDHKAFYLFLQIALGDIANVLPRPEIYPYLVHCMGWPLPRHYHPELELSPPKQMQDSQVSWLQYALSPEQLEKKHQAILCHKSQTRSSAFYLLSFARKNELFGDYPEIGLVQPKQPVPSEVKAEPSFMDKAIAFFGLSNLFTDSSLGAEISSAASISEVKGKVDYSCDDNFLLIRVKKEKELDKNFSVLVYLFGYSDAVPFAQMPKIRIFSRHGKAKAFNGKKPIAVERVITELRPEEFILKVPLDMLGRPASVLTLVKTFGGALPVDTTGFRKILLR